MNICRAMGGWKYEWAEELPRAVRAVLVAELNRKE
jgi:hypothetical protein